MHSTKTEGLADLSVVGIDIGKDTFHLVGFDDDGNLVLRTKIKRLALKQTFEKLPRCIVGMEACLSAHFVSRTLRGLGFEPRIIPAIYTKPFIKGQKNDYNDAEAIAEAALRPNLPTVSEKSQDQLDLQALQSLHRARERLIHQRTSTTNQIRSLVAEEGIVCAQGIAQLKRCLHDIVSDQDSVTPLLRALIGQFLEQLAALDQWIGELDQKIHRIAKHSLVCRQLVRLPGVGPVIATAVLGSVANAHAFKNGRQFAASLGLVPGQRSSGGRKQLLGITKRGDAYLRKLLVQGARAIMRVAGRHDDRQSQWVRQLLTRRPKLSFAAHMRGINRQALPLKFPAGHLEDLPTMDSEDWHELRQRMRDKYAVHISKVQQGDGENPKGEDNVAGEEPDDGSDDPGSRDPDRPNTDPSPTW